MAQILDFFQPVPLFPHFPHIAILNQVAQEPLRSWMSLPRSGAKKTLGTLEVLGKAFLGGHAKSFWHLKKNIYKSINVNIHMSTNDYVYIYISLKNIHV